MDKRRFGFSSPPKASNRELNIPISIICASVFWDFIAFYELSLEFCDVLCLAASNYYEKLGLPWDRDSIFVPHYN